MSKKCVCGNEMTREDWKHEWVCHRCGEQDEGLWRLLGRAEGFEGTVFTEEQDDE